MDWKVVVGKGLVHAQCVRLDSSATTPLEAFEEVATALAGLHGIDASVLAHRLSMREGRRSTACGYGFALPHADTYGLSRPQGVHLRSKHPMAFLGARDGVPVHDILVLVAPRPATSVYTGMLHHYRTLIQQPHFREKLHALHEPGPLWLLWREHEWSRELSLTPALLDQAGRGPQRQLRVRRHPKTGRS